MPNQGPSRDEGEIEFTAEELAEMQVDLATKEDAGQTRRKKRALRVPADEVPRQASPATEPQMPPMDPSSESDDAVDHAFSNGGRAEAKVKAPPKFTNGDAEVPKARARQYAKTIPMPTSIPDEDLEPEISVTSEPEVTKLPPNVRALMRALAPVAARSERREDDVEQLDSSELETESEALDPDRTEEQQALPPREMIPERMIHAPRESATAPSSLLLEDDHEDSPELTIEQPALETHSDAEEVEADEVTDDVVESPKRPSPPAMPDAAARARSTTLPSIVQPATAPLQPPPPPQAPVLQAPTEELRPRRRRRVKQWFEEIFDDDYLRTLPYLSARETEREAAFVAESLGLEPGSPILDVACGYGRHAMELAGRGYQVTGIDLSLPLLIRAADAARRIGVAVNFVHGDMREMTFEQEFEGAYCTFTSFGYFDDDTNRKVAANLQRALKPGGRVLIELVNRDYITKDLPTRVWWQGEGCVVLEEVDFNYFSSRLQVQRSIIFEDGRQLEQEISIRAYSLHEIGKVLHHAGFRVIEVSGGLSLRGKFFGAHSRQLLVLAEKKIGG